MSSILTQSQLCTATPISSKSGAGNQMVVAEWTDTYGIHHWRTRRSSYRNLAHYSIIFFVLWQFSLGKVENQINQIISAAYGRRWARIFLTFFDKFGKNNQSFVFKMKFDI